MKTGIIFLLLVLIAIPAEAETYRWVDSQGNTTYTDDLGNIPQKYRKNAKVVGAEEEEAKPAEGKGAASTGAKAKETGGGEVQAPAAPKELKKSYGGKAAEAWRRDFSQLNADIKAAEDQLAELKERMKDTSKMSRGEYLSIQTGINGAEARVQRLTGKLETLNAEADKAGVPAELRGQ